DVQLPALPELASDAAVWLVGGGALHLVTADEDRLHVWSRRDGAWESSERRLDGRPAPTAVIAVEGQLVGAWVQTNEDEPPTVELALLRESGPALLAEVSVGSAGISPQVMAMGRKAAVIAAGDGEGQEAQPVLVTVDLQGTRSEPMTLTVPAPSIMPGAGPYLVLVGALVLSTIVMVLAWRKDPSRQQVELPDDLVPAPLMRRSAAAVVDLAVPLATVILTMDVSTASIVETWPGRGGAWEDALPGLALIGGLVTWTTVTELAFGRSPGKLLTGLKVVDTKGGPAAWWQRLVRNVLKVFELIAWVLLLLPILSRERQRLGDIVASTVVVVDAPEESS
ncbi:MAG: RDD family protein, partial [Phycisphaeraceae bacterium]|nr:RDD family protein [Phycisphaeraceae bacterium]